MEVSHKYIVLVVIKSEAGLGEGEIRRSTDLQLIFADEIGFMQGQPIIFY